MFKYCDSSNFCKTCEHCRFNVSGRVVYSKLSKRSTRNSANLGGIGLAILSPQGKIMKVYARFNRQWSSLDDICPEYGAIDQVDWYDSGINMTLQQWIQLSFDTEDAMGFYHYWTARLKGRECSCEEEGIDLFLRMCQKAILVVGFPLTWTDRWC